MGIAIIPEEGNARCDDALGGGGLRPAGGCLRGLGAPAPGEAHAALGPAPHRSRVLCLRGALRVAVARGRRYRHGPGRARPADGRGQRLGAQPADLAEAAARFPRYRLHDLLAAPRAAYVRGPLAHASMAPLERAGELAFRLSHELAAFLFL